LKLRNNLEVKEMFDPSNVGKDKQAKNKKKRVLQDLKLWSEHLVPEDIREGL